MNRANSLPQHVVDAFKEELLKDVSLAALEAIHPGSVLEICALTAFGSIVTQYNLPDDLSEVIDQVMRFYTRRLRKDLGISSEQLQQFLACALERVNAARRNYRENERRRQQND